MSFDAMGCRAHAIKVRRTRRDGNHRDAHLSRFSRGKDSTLAHVPECRLRE
jgi:hypothetical protein